LLESATVSVLPYSSTYICSKCCSVGTFLTCFLPIVYLHLRFVDFIIMDKQTNICVILSLYIYKFTFTSLSLKIGPYYKNDIISQNILTLKFQVKCRSIGQLSGLIRHVHFILVHLEGRDKFCKSIQYACRFLKFHYEQKGDLKMAKKIDSLFGAMRDSRKLFRLFKTINEYKKISDILKKNPSINVDNGLSILTRAFFGVYWIFDNLAILSKLKIFDKDPKTYSKTGATFWLLALLTNLISIVKDIIANEKKVEHLKRYEYFIIKKLPIIFT
jgi:hypothetical protein